MFTCWIAMKTKENNVWLKIYKKKKVAYSNCLLKKINEFTAHLAHSFIIIIDMYFFLHDLVHFNICPMKAGAVPTSFFILPNVLYLIHRRHSVNCYSEWKNEWINSVWLLMPHTVFLIHLCLNSSFEKLIEILRLKRVLQSDELNDSWFKEG